MEEEKKLKAEWEERNKNKSSIQTSINGSAVSNHQQHEGGDAENGSKKHESEASDIWTMEQIEEKSQELQKRLKEDNQLNQMVVELTDRNATPTKNDWEPPMIPYSSDDDWEDRLMKL